MNSLLVVLLAKINSKTLDSLLVFSRWDQFAIKKNRDWVKLWLIQVSNDTCYETVHPERNTAYCICIGCIRLSCCPWSFNHSFDLWISCNIIHHIVGPLSMGLFCFKLSWCPHGKEYQSCHDPDRETCKDKDFVEGSADYHVEGCFCPEGTVEGCKFFLLKITYSYLMRGWMNDSLFFIIWYVLIIHIIWYSITKFII